MKINRLLAIISFAGIAILTSCGNDATNTTTNTVDTATVQIPEELSKINAELLADPNNADLFHKRAKYYYNAKKIEAGLADMKRVMNIDSSKADYFLTLSDLYFVSNKTANAKLALEKCIKLDKKNTAAMLKLAELYLYVRKHDQSIEYINMALKVDQYNSKAYFMKGMNYKELKDTTRAISSMQTAVEQDQKYYQAFMQLGILCAAQKNSLAVQYYKNAIRIEPKSVEAWYDLGKYYQDVKDWNNSLETYNALLQIDPANKNVHYNMAAIHLLNLKEFNVAVDHFSAAIDIDPEFVQAYYGRGIAYQSIGKKKLALADFNACIIINPHYEPAQVSLNKLK